MPGLATPLLWVLGAGLVAGAAIKRSTEAAEESESADREKRHAAGFGQFGGFREDYEENIAPNCREYPAFGVPNAMACAMTRQGDNLMYNSLLGNNWQQNLGCPLNWNQNNQQCYFVGTTETWADAKTLCRNAGSTLASIQSQSELQFVASLLAAQSIPVNTPVFIGGKVSPVGQWLWIADNSPVENGFLFAPWTSGAPTDGDQVMTVVLKPGGVSAPPTAEWDTTSAVGTQLRYLCKKQEATHIPGLCRWDANRANSDTKSACMCPTNMETCNKRPNCFWYEDPRTPFKECISKAERFYNRLLRLLMRRGKKDFAIKIRDTTILR